MEMVPIGAWMRNGSDRSKEYSIKQGKATGCCTLEKGKISLEEKSVLQDEGEWRGQKHIILIQIVV